MVRRIVKNHIVAAMQPGDTPGKTRNGFSGCLARYTRKF